MVYTYGFGLVWAGWTGAGAGWVACKGAGPVGAGAWPVGAGAGPERGPRDDGVEVGVGALDVKLEGGSVGCDDIGTVGDTSIVVACEAVFGLGNGIYCTVFDWEFLGIRVKSIGADAFEVTRGCEFIGIINAQRYK